jgi:hypothetical protein
VRDGAHIIRFEDLPHLRLCYDEWIALAAPDRECAWLLDVSGETAAKKAAWNSRLNGYCEPDVSPELAARCHMLLHELTSRLAAFAQVCADSADLGLF